MGTYEAERATSDRSATAEYGEPDLVEWEERLRLGQDVRFVLAAVGGGAIRIAREIARQHVRHLECVAINCDPKVQGFDEFDRRVYLGPDSGADVDTGGSPFVGGMLARAAEPALQRIFHGATFVILIGSLGGGAGSGAFPYILEVASRNAEVVSAFVVKPFRCEGDRRALADRAIGRLHFVQSFTEKRERGLATLQILDNESLVRHHSQLAISRLSQHWAAVVEEHIERSFLAPAEAILEAFEMNRVLHESPMNRIPPVEAAALRTGPSPVPLPAPAMPPHGVGPAQGFSSEVELTFEVDRPDHPRAAQ